MTIQHSMMFVWASSFLAATGCLIAEYHFSGHSPSHGVTSQDTSLYIPHSDFLQQQNLIRFDAQPSYQAVPLAEVKAPITRKVHMLIRRECAGVSGRARLSLLDSKRRRAISKRRIPASGPLVGNGAQVIAGGMKVKPAKALAEWKKVRKEALFSWPVEPRDFWVSSLYGPRRNPNGRIAFHAGVDMAAQKGTIVHAAGEGVVSEACYAPGYGNYIMITHPDMFKTRYAHLDKIYVTVGQKVVVGDHIGRVGATGFVRKSKRGGSGSHLHFEIYKRGKAVNPLFFLHSLY